MNTQITLFSQQLFVNPRFSVSTNDYGWTTTGNYVSTEGKITKVAGGNGTVRQNDILIEGAEYRLKFIITDRSAGQVFIINKAGGTVHETVNADGAFDVTFTADGPDLIFSINSTFDGSIQNCYIAATPEQWDMELSADVQMPFTFSLDDITDFQRRKTTWSKTVTLPGTHHNNRALRALYQIDGESLFDPRKKARAIIQSGAYTFDGHMSVDSINDFGNGIRSYDTQFVGRLGDIKSKFGNLSIKDLDFSNYDHEFNLRNISFNWGFLSEPSSNVFAGYNYCHDSNNPTASPIIPGLQLQTVNATHTGVSGLSQETLNGMSLVKITFTTPHPFAYEDELQIQSPDNNLLNGTHTVLSVPASDAIVISMAWSQLTSTSTHSSTKVDSITWKGRGIAYPMIDQGSYMKELTSGSLQQGAIYRCIEKGFYDDFTNLATDPHTGAAIPVHDGTIFRANDGTTAAGAPVSPTKWIGSRLLVHALPEEDGVSLYSKDLMVRNWYASDLRPVIFVHEVWTKMMAAIGYTYESDLIDGNTFKKLVMPCDAGFNVVASEGQWVRLNDWLPGMKLSDFFTSVVGMFNLLVIEDPEVPNKITLKCRNTFHDDSVMQTWHMDNKEPLKIDLASKILPKSVQLKYAEGTDFYNKDFNKDYGDIANANGLVHEVDRRYGDYYTGTRNEFSDRRDVTQVKFAPTVMVGPLTQSPGGIYLESDKNLSVMYNADDSGQNLTRNNDFRIMFIGIRGSDYQMSLSSQRTTTGTNALYNFTNWTQSIQFLGAWHVDNYTDAVPQHDLNFGPLLAQYFGGQEYNQTLWLNNTIYGRYWQRYLEDILNRNTKHITGLFKLSTSDMAKLDFKNLIRPFGTNYTLKLQQINDFDINGDGLCECQFLSKNV